MLGPALLKNPASGVASYATLLSGTTGLTLDAGDLSFNALAGGRAHAFSTVGKSAGKHYFEVSFTGSASPIVGMASERVVTAVGKSFGLQNLAADGISWGAGWYFNGRDYRNGSYLNSYWDVMYAGISYGLYVDFGAKLTYGWKTGTGWKASAAAPNPATGTYYAALGTIGNSGSVAINFGQSPFAFPFGSPPGDVTLGYYE